MSLELYVISRYLNIDKTISSLKVLHDDISDKFYREHSIVGGMTLGINENVYTRSYNPEQSTLMIIEQEEEIQSYIERLRRKKAIFSKVFSDKEIESFKKAISENKTTNAIRKAVELLEEQQKPPGLSKETYKKFEQARQEHKRCNRKKNISNKITKEELARIDKLLIELSAV